jgi:hypothetical protein
MSPGVQTTLSCGGNSAQVNPSPALPNANAVSTLRLFVLLGGSSYPGVRASIGSREIKNNSVRSSDLRHNDVRGKGVRRNTLGRQVNKRRLGAVPLAARAVTADRAGDASTVGGVGPDAFKLRCPTGTGLNAGLCVEEPPARPRLAGGTPSRREYSRETCAPG